MGRAPKRQKTAESSAPKKQTSKKPKSTKGIVRIAGKDVPGENKLKMALMRVKGINNNLATILSKYISNKLNIAINTEIGSLNEETRDKISNILFDLGNADIPKWLLNRQKDRISGSDTHVIMNDWKYYLREDIEHEKKLYTWRGYRHAYGQKVRGQKTKNTGRRGIAVGVIRKSQQPAKKGQSSGGSKSGAKK